MHVIDVGVAAAHLSVPISRGGEGERGVVADQHVRRRDGQRQIINSAVLRFRFRFVSL